MLDEFDDDIFDKIKKLFKFNSDKIDFDLYFFPESRFGIKNLNPISDKDKNKGFKVSYHYETGMNEPEINFEGDIDPNKLKDYLQHLHKNGLFGPEKLIPEKSKNYIDAKELSVEPNKAEKKLPIVEPYTEINDHEDFSEIIIEIPGIEKNDTNITLSESGENLIFSARNPNKNFYKEIYLPFRASFNDYDLDVNNGIAILKVRKTI